MGDDTEMTRLARLAAMQMEEPGRAEAATPGSFGCHEALDRTFLLMDMLGNWLLEHPAIISDEDWFRLADEAHTKLMDMYQAIGAKHL